ncbi:Plastocyanin [Pandoraea iniqua]|uniref:Plastocyanin n=1 Tax=Pandoraea iniqua TaxID=2508288 RepID=A0A5E4WWM8_9BURK|nr:cupredoxin family copper-binding protein [Pandoraea iniqua]VVE29237.1 Plastocyanin [Pandoraea iniqua]
MRSPSHAMRRFCAGLVTVCAAVALPASPAMSAGATTAASDPNTVRIDNFTFAPATLTVPVGTKITWVNRDNEPHTVTSQANPREFASAALDTGDTFVRTFDKPGTYAYYCAIHPHMTGVIIVK